MGITVRKMTEDDIDFVSELDKAVFKISWSEQSVRDEFVKDYAYYYIAESDGEKIGYAGIWCIYETGEIARIAARPMSRRMGAGDALMCALMSKAREKNCENVMLEVRASNVPAKALYEKHGFKEVSVRRGYYDGEDASVMVCGLK